MFRICDAFIFFETIFLTSSQTREKKIDQTIRKDPTQIDPSLL